ncbi:unnamed protein product [Paramecium octaurelia]|uniref:Uncharacterized protein n=1 Tax=Paramecium octaurelia TaxID=43137 RepID=A0A8S1UY93_PAROT|nr:unnamed protein product [Paramecium octaurelia]
MLRIVKRIERLPNNSNILFEQSNEKREQELLLQNCLKAQCVPKQLYVMTELARCFDLENLVKQ